MAAPPVLLVPTAARSVSVPLPSVPVRPTEDPSMMSDRHQKENFVRNLLSSIILVLLLGLPAFAQGPLSLIPEEQPALSPLAQGRAFGEIILAPVGEDSVVVVLDRHEVLQGQAGFADLVVVFRTSSSVINLPTVRDVGLLRVEKDGVVVTFPRQQLRYDLTLRDEREVPAGATLIHGTALATWMPEANQDLTVDEALSLERARHAEVRSTIAGLFQKDPGSGSGGGCAASMSITCHDGSSASASCPAGQCADCSCPNAGCGCFVAP